MKVTSNFTILMQKAQALAKAKKEGDPNLIEKAQKELDIYESICLNSDEMSLDCYWRDLN